MNVIEAIERKCASHPGLKYQKSGNGITVSPEAPEGFPITYSFHNNKHQVGFLGWHEVFANPEEALNCFVFGLSGKCRLEIWKRGKFPYKWILEARDSKGGWYKDSEVGLLFFPFWRKRSIIHLQNSVLKE